MRPESPFDLYPRLHITADPYDLSFSVFVAAFNAAGQVTAFGQPIVMHQIQDDEVGRSAPAAAPTLRMGRQGLQILMNDLWALGFRPRDGSGSVAQVDAMREHIGDLREMVRQLMLKMTTERDRKLSRGELGGPK